MIAFKSKIECSNYSWLKLPEISIHLKSFWNSSISTVSEIATLHILQSCKIKIRQVKWSTSINLSNIYKNLICISSRHSLLQLDILKRFSTYKRRTSPLLMNSIIRMGSFGSELYLKNKILLIEIRYSSEGWRPEQRRKGNTL